MKHMTKYDRSLLCYNKTDNLTKFTDIPAKDYNAVEDICINRYANEIICYTEYYNYYEEQSHVKSLNLVKINLLPKTSLFLIYEQNLKIPVEEYLCLMAGICSLWFGIEGKTRAIFRPRPDPNPFG